VRSFFSHVNFAEKLPQVVEIVRNFEGNGLLIQRAKASIEAQDLRSRLMYIQQQYSELSRLVEIMEGTQYTTKQAFQDVSEMDFGEDA